MPPSNIIFEQPLNEQMRCCLRLEYLFQKIKYFIEDDSSWSSRSALETLMEISTVTDRPDLRSKLSKALSSYAMPLKQLMGQKSSLPIAVDEKKLRRIHDQLDEFMEKLHADVGKIGQSLRSNEFITTIQQRNTSAGGTCPFNTPAYHLWLEQTAKTRIRDLENWFANFTWLKSIITMILKLTRESSSFVSAHAQEGFYQINLDPKLSYQMIRIALPANEKIYPEISVGRHRLSVHFYELNTEGHPEQEKNKIAFELACCKI